MKGGALDWLMPDDLRFRIAAWGFYDGLYDYGTSQFHTQELLINKSFNNNVPTEPPGNIRQGGWFVMGPNIKLRKGATNFSQIFPGFSLYEPRSIYGNTERVNELYLSYSKGPFFLRFGRQSISWG